MQTQFMSLPQTLAATLLTVIPLALCHSDELPAQELTEQRFQDLHQQLQPDASEPWRSIPWQTNLLEAQRVAAERGHPIFIWAMDGHPLGCT